MRTPSKYSDNVFINCPFDNAYNHLFEAIIFVVHDCGFIARCAREEDDAGDVRINKIMKIIDQCKYGIHDISKADLDLNTHLARFNMPLELGLYLGAQRYSPTSHYNREKKAIVMDSDQFRYRNFISDLSGQDILGHNNSVGEIIIGVRNFLFTNSKRNTITGGNFIFDRFNEYLKGLPNFCDTLHWDRDRLTFIEYVTCVTEWIKINPY